MRRRILTLTYFFVSSEISICIDFFPPPSVHLLRPPSSEPPSHTPLQAKQHPIDRHPLNEKKRKEKREKERKEKKDRLHQFQGSGCMYVQSMFVNIKTATTIMLTFLSSTSSPCICNMYMYMYMCITCAVIRTTYYYYYTPPSLAYMQTSSGNQCIVNKWSPSRVPLPTLVALLTLLTYLPAFSNNKKYHRCYKQQKWREKRREKENPPSNPLPGFAKWFIQSTHFIIILLLLLFIDASLDPKPLNNTQQQPRLMRWDLTKKSTRVENLFIYFSSRSHCLFSQRLEKREVEEKMPWPHRGGVTTYNPCHRSYLTAPYYCFSTRRFY